MKRLLILILSVFLLFACKGQGDRYLVEGKTQKVKDGTKLFLKDIESGKFIDSCFVNNNEFYLNGKISSSALKVALTTERKNLYCSFWLENADMFFDASEKDFFFAVVSGSKTQDEYKNMLYKRDNFSTDSLSLIIQKEAIDLMQSESSWRGVKGKEKIALAKLANLEKEWDLLDCMYEMQYVRDYPNSIISASTLSFYATSWGRKVVKKMYIQLSDDLKKTVYGDKIRHFLALNKEFKIGDSIVDFTMSDRNDNLVRFSSLKAKYVLLQFWSSQCGPCLREIPELAQVYDDYKYKGLEVLAVSIDNNKQKWIEAIDKYNLDWVNVCDYKHAENEAAIIYGVSRVPYNILVDNKGYIIAMDVIASDLRSSLKELI